MISIATKTIDFKLISGLFLTNKVPSFRIIASPLKGNAFSIASSMTSL